MGWIGSVCCEKPRCDFVARTFALIAPVQYVLQQVSCSYEMIPNAPKYYEKDWNFSFGSNGLDWVRSLRKISMWLRCTNFCINCTSSPRFAPSFKQLRNDPKCTQTLWNTPNTWVYGPMGWIRCVHCEKLQRDFLARTFVLMAPVRPDLHRVSCSNEMVPNAPKHYKTHHNFSLWSNGMDRMPPLRKIPMRLRCTNFCINCTSSARFAPSFMQ